jgi:hypothetical protein
MSKLKFVSELKGTYGHSSEPNGNIRDGVQPTNHGTYIPKPNASACFWGMVRCCKIMKNSSP